MFGPLPAKFGLRGPFDSSVDYFKSWAALHGKILGWGQSLPYMDADATEMTELAQGFPHRLESDIKTILAKLEPGEISGRYTIVHPEFAMQNILLDAHMEVVGVIDWEGSYTAPLEVAGVLMNMYLYLEEDATVRPDGKKAS